ncbi:MAG TPA: hypothetical protein VG367_00820 [Mucilaginibacter sp.]|nr:hypothetical protein [Mucilaginibacter sp.]
MKRKILSLVTLAAICTMLITGCAERHGVAPPPPPPPGGAPPPPPSR